MLRCTAGYIGVVDSDDTMSVAMKVAMRSVFILFVLLIHVLIVDEYKIPSFTYASDNSINDFYYS